MGRLQARACDLLTSPAAQRAFQLGREASRVRDAYGRNVYGQSLLLARRLVEAGTRLACISWAPDANATWDTHGQNFAKLKNELQARFEKAGLMVEDARLTHLAYAPEIAGAMLRRQQAEAVIGARKQIVAGAVGMVEMALASLTERGVVDLDPERRAAMVSNLLVVLCAETEAQPVINAGTLYG
jgi:hypothetical protein